MKFRIFIIAAFLFLNSGITNAQILNIDKIDTSDYVNKAKFNLTFSTGLEIDKQQTTLFDATNTAELMLQKKKELFIFAANYRFTQDGNDDILNTGYFHLRFRHHYKDKIQPESFIQYQWDSERGLVYRALGGANIRYNFFKGDKWEVNAGLGLMYEVEKWNYSAVDSSKLPANTTPITNNLIKLNSYIRANWKTSESSTIILGIFLQTRPDIFQPRISQTVQWTISAGKHIAFNINFSGIYDQSPVVPIHKYYYSISNGIQVKI